MNSRDRILLVTTSYMRAKDGSDAAGVFVFDLAHELARHMRVTVVAPGMSEGSSMQGAVEVRTFRAPQKALSLLSPGNPLDWLAIVRTLRSLKKVTLASNADADVRHALALWVLPCGWATRSLQRKQGVAYSVWALGSDIWSLGRLPLVRSALGLVARDAKYAYADGMRLAEDAKRITGREFAFMPSTRKLVADRARAVAMQPPYRLLFLGRWHKNKGVDLLLDALRLLGEQDWARIAEVHIAGGGPLEAEVRLGVDALKALGRPMRLSGYLDSEQAAAAFSDADRVLLPSRVESIPVIYSDAMKFSLPVVAMPVGDLPGLIGEGTGWLAERVDAEAFCAAIRAALGPGYGTEAVESMNRRFSIEKIAADIAASIDAPARSDST